MKTQTLIERETRAARIHARRATRAVGVFTLWLLVTWLGPELSPVSGWSTWSSLLAVGLYALLTCAALACVWWSATRVLVTGVLRRVVSAHLAPFWIVLAGCVCAGGAVFRAVDDPVVSTWLAAGTGLSLLTACYALARRLEIRALAEAKAHLEHAPSDVALRTWQEELGARIEAASSIRLDHP